MTGKIICAGLGPGDPDLMSVKSWRLVKDATDIAYFRKKGRAGMARKIVDGMLRDDVTEYAMEYPVTTEIRFDDPEYKRQLAAFYEDWAARLQTLAATKDIVVLCEGDPFFYGSFMHLYTRLQGKIAIEVIPGITGMSGCWTETGIPVTWGDDVLTVLTGTLDQQELTRRMQDSDAFVVMKTGRNLAKIRQAAEETGRLQDAWLVEYGTMPKQKISRLQDVDVNACPYFALVVAHGQGRRP